MISRGTIDGRTLIVLMRLAERVPDLHLNEDKKERKSAIDNVKYCLQNLNFEVVDK